MVFTMYVEICYFCSISKSEVVSSNGQRIVEFVPNIFSDFPFISAVIKQKRQMFLKSFHLKQNFVWIIQFKKKKTLYRQQVVPNDENGEITMDTLHSRICSMFESDTFDLILRLHYTK